jgi:hypothetical protein
MANRQDNRMNSVIMARERLSFRSSPDKGRAGGVCSGEIGFPHMISRPNPPHSPLVRGEMDKQPLSSTLYGGFMRLPWANRFSLKQA